MKNKEIKMIGLLNRLYNDNAPKTIKFRGVIYKLDEDLNVYQSEETGNTMGYDFNIDMCLENTVEILSEDMWKDIKSSISLY